MSNESLIRHLSADEVVRYLVSEQSLKDRFPCRFIFVSSFSQYKGVVEALRLSAKKIVRLSDSAFCRGDDVVPVFSRVVNAIREGEDESYLIEGMGEYLRLAENNRALGLDVISLLNLECHSRKRVWIPLFLSKPILFKITGELNHRHDNAFYEIDAIEEPLAFRLNVFPAAMASVLGGSVIKGIREWLRHWEALSISSGDVLATRNAELFTAVEGTYAIRVVKSPFAYLRDSLQDAGSLSEDMGTPEQWAWLSSKVNRSIKTLDKLIKEILNVAHFDAIDALSRWDDNGRPVSDNVKWLIWLWYHKGANVGGDYFSFAIGKAKSPKDVPLMIETAILDESFKNNVDEAREVRRLAVRRVCGAKRSKEFWTGLSKIADDYLKLKLLTADTKEERTEIIKTAGKMLHAGERLHDVMYVLEVVYPELAYYLTHSEYAGEFKDYFAEYKHQKICDVFDSKIEDMLSKSSLLAVQSRNSAIKELRKNAEFVLCVDGMGVEWLDMLLWQVSRIDPDVAAQVEVASALLPTETAANRFWDDWPKNEWKKDDRLDAKSHIKDRSDGVDHGALTELQFEIVRKIAEDVVELINERDKVVLTADHGLSRLAAIHFNKLSGVTPPAAAVANGAQCCRYCQVDKSYHSSSDMYMRQKDLLVMATHNHFRVSGWIPGETHGGMTPEEYLVPVVAFSRVKPGEVKPEVPSYKIMESKVKLQPEKARFIIEAAGLKSLKASANNEIVNGTQLSGDLWEVVFSSLKSGEKYEMSVFPNNMASGKKHEIEILRRGLIVEDDF